MRILYLLISLISCVSFAADDQEGCFVPASSSSLSSSSSSSSNSVYPVPECLQKALNIFSSHARDARFTPAQKANYSILALKASLLMQMLNAGVNPKPVITNYHSDTPLDKAEYWGKTWLKNGRGYVSHTLKRTLPEIDEEIRQRISVHAPIFRFAQPMSQAEVFTPQPAAPQPVVPQLAAPMITTPAVTTSTTPQPVAARKRTVRSKKSLPIDSRQRSITSFFTPAQPEGSGSSSSSTVILIDSDSDEDYSQNGLSGKKPRRN